MEHEEEETNVQVTTTNPGTKKVQWPPTDSEGLFSVTDETEDPFYYEQHGLEMRAAGYRSPKCYGPGFEKRTCIWSGGDPFSWTPQTAGISWIGVNNGKDTTFAVARKAVKGPDAVWSQLASISVLFMAVADMGVYADTSTPTTEFRRQMIADSSPNEVGAFAVVSLAPDAVEDPLGSSNENSSAINFLAEKLKGRSTLAYGEIKQIAVCAFKHLMGPKFDPDMIEVKGSGERGGEGWVYERNFGALEVRELLAGMNQA